MLAENANKSLVKLKAFISGFPLLTVSKYPNSNVICQVKHPYTIEDSKYYQLIRRLEAFGFKIIRPIPPSDYILVFSPKES